LLCFVLFIAAVVAGAYFALRGKKGGDATSGAIEDKAVPAPPVAAPPPVASAAPPPPPPPAAKPGAPAGPKLPPPPARSSGATIIAFDGDDDDE
jgi:hypothetical protein